METATNTRPRGVLIAIGNDDGEGLTTEPTDAAPGARAHGAVG
jgi:hypothetical protein